MGSLGTTNNRDRFSQKKMEPPKKTSVSINIPKEKSETRYYFIYILTGIVHLGIAAYILTIDFVYPVTIFQTRLRENVQDYFTCVYDNLGTITRLGIDEYLKGSTSSSELFTNEVTILLDAARNLNVTDFEGLTSFAGDEMFPSNFCKNTDRASSSPQDIAECQIAISQYASNIGNVTSQGPWIAAYELVEIVSDTMLPRMLLFFAVSITCIMDFYKAYMFRKKLTTESSDFSGIPSLWIEYSFTFFMASVAQVFDLNFLVASILSQFSLMYFGLVIDKLLDLGYTNLSLVLFWQPGMALFAITWYPIFQNIVLLKPVLCKSGPSFLCDPTCFESDYMYSIYVILSFFIFSLFPMVTLYKIRKYNETFASYPLLGFLLYVPYSFVLSLYFVIFGDSKLYEKRSASKYYDRRTMFIVNQVLYSILSLTSKVFITMFFITQFATNFPWRNIQQTLA